ncbi:MAG TPA: exodeoxyribonuclease VII small subunit [Candidatus Saccharimonadales bacterium]|nr:exodeoxyribonuclease VII small subunit [Candidatus Saccharimonadales bacterium]
MAQKESSKTYQELSSELDHVLAQLQQPDIAVDEAVKLYEQGIKLAGELEKHIAKAENTLQKVRLQLSEEQ